MAYLKSRSKKVERRLELDLAPCTISYCLPLSVISDVWPLGNYILTLCSYGEQGSVKILNVTTGI